MSRDMCRAAQRGEWTEVQDLSRARDRLLEAAMSGERRLRALQGFAAELHELHALDERIVALAVACRDELGARLLHRSKGKRARSAYDESSY